MGAPAEVTVCHGNRRSRGGGASQGLPVRRLGSRGTLPAGGGGGEGASGGVGAPQFGLVSARVSSAGAEERLRRRGCRGAVAEAGAGEALVSPAEPLCGVGKHRNNSGGAAGGTDGSGRSLAAALGQGVSAGAAACREPGEAGRHRRARGSLRGRSGLRRAPAAVLLRLSERRGASGRSLQPRASLRSKCWPLEAI